MTSAPMNITGLWNTVGLCKYGEGPWEEGERGGGRVREERGSKGKEGEGGGGKGKGDFGWLATV